MRSIELDDWSDEQVAAMRSVGNARSNAFFESEMDPALPSTLTDSWVSLALFVSLVSSYETQLICARV